LRARILFGCVALAAAGLAGAASALGVCGPFADVSDAAFCPFVLEIFTLGITTGTTPTTYNPAGNVTRLQMAAFLSRSVDGVLLRGSRRALRKKYWTPQSALALGLTSLPVAGGQIVQAQSDGRDVWVSDGNDGRVFRVRASDGRYLETWTGAAGAWGIVPAMGRVFVTGITSPAALYRIDPSQPAGSVTTVATGLGGQPTGVAFDGARIWTANLGGPASVSIVTPGSSLPWTVTTVTAGFIGPEGVVYDGANVWALDTSGSTLKKLDGGGAILQTVTVGGEPHSAVFDGTNIWVASTASDSITVIRSSTGVVLATLTGNGLSAPFQAAVDGSRYLVTDSDDRVSLWKTADLTPLGFFSMPASSLPFSACSDSVDFWIVLRIANKLARF
jgi:hypothetical protein